MVLARLSIYIIALLITASIVTDSFDGFSRTSPFLGAIVITTLLCALYCWIWGIYHCLTHQFKRKYYKAIWLFLMVWLNFIGAIIYHVLVCELQLTIRKEEEKKDAWGESIRAQISSSNWLARISILYYLVFFTILTCLGVFQSKKPPSWALFFGMIMVGLLFYLWIRSIVHCSKSNFTKSWMRPAWFVFIFFGQALTATIYHIVVVEMRWTLK